MKTFLQWAEDNKLDLPVMTDSESKKDATSEGAYRRRIKFGHPDAEGAANYPPAYFAPGSATAYLDLKQRKQQKMAKDTGGHAAD